MNANRYALCPPIGGPCNASPVHSSFAWSASKRPNTSTGVPSPRPPTPWRVKSRWIVRSDGAHPSAVAMMRRICAAVRAGRSRFNASATSNTGAGVRGSAVRPAGTNASNPPARYARIQRSNVLRETWTRPPWGPAWSWAAR